jgi:hypothetical protein
MGMLCGLNDIVIILMVTNIHFKLLGVVLAVIGALVLLAAIPMTFISIKRLDSLAAQKAQMIDRPTYVSDEWLAKHEKDKTVVNIKLAADTLMIAAKLETQVRIALTVFFGVILIIAGLMVLKFVKIMETRNAIKEMSKLRVETSHTHSQTRERRFL